jgi:hypothetical protein
MSLTILLAIAHECVAIVAVLTSSLPIAVIEKSPT